MPDVAAVLKEEITRLARKEVKQQVGPLRNMSRTLPSFLLKSSLSCCRSSPRTRYEPAKSFAAIFVPDEFDGCPHAATGGESADHQAVDAG